MFSVFSQPVQANAVILPRLDASRFIVIHHLAVILLMDILWSGTLSIRNIGKIVIVLMERELEAIDVFM
jgi:hypothetical protein